MTSEFPKPLETLRLFWYPLHMFCLFVHLFVVRFASETKQIYADIKRCVPRNTCLVQTQACTKRVTPHATTERHMLEKRKTYLFMYWVTVKPFRSKPNVKTMLKGKQVGTDCQDQIGRKWFGVDVTQWKWLWKECGHVLNTGQFIIKMKHFGSQNIDVWRQVAA